MARRGGGRRRESPRIEESTYSLSTISTLLYLSLAVLVAVLITYVFMATPNTAVATDTIADTITDAANCTPQGAEATSAMSRATTAECRAKLMTTICRLQAGTLTATTMPRSCPLAVTARRHARIGCFVDEGVVDGDRLLNGTRLDVDDNSPVICVNKCLMLGFQLAGVEAGTRCYCGHKARFENRRRSAPDVECETHVCGEQFCGGLDRVAVYDTGFGGLLQRTVPYTAPSGLPPPRVLFLLQLNGRSSRQVVRLIKLLFRHYHYFIVHVDQRQAYMFNEMLAVQAKLSSLGHTNFHVSTNRFRPGNSGNSLLPMYLSMVREALESLAWKAWSHVLNLSESDFPMASMAELEHLLATHPRASFLRSHGASPARFLAKQALDRVFVECEGRMWRVGSRERIPTGIWIDGGSDWLVLSRELVEFALYSDDALVPALMHFYANTILPVESFFHTLAYNSPLCAHVINLNLKFTNWLRTSGGCNCQHRAVVDWCGCSPSAHTLGSITRVRAKYTQLQWFFTRKVDSIIDIRVVDRLEMIVRLTLRHRSPMKALNASTPPWTDAANESYWLNEYTASVDIASPLRSNFMTSVATIALDRLGRHCSTPSITSMTSYLPGYGRQVESLVAYTTECADGRLALETRFVHALSPKSLAAVPSSTYRVMALNVGTDFDVKQLIYRNYVGDTGVLQPMTVRYELAADKSTNRDELTTKLLVDWYDPSEQIVHRQSKWMETMLAHVVNYTTLVLTSHSMTCLRWEPTTPLVAGVWTVRLSAKHVDASSPTAVASVDFPVYPDEQSGEATQLVERFTTFKDTCNMDGAVDGHPDCRTTPHSSSFPDPKSTIAAYNTKTFLM